MPDGALLLVAAAALGIALGFALRAALQRQRASEAATELATAQERLRGREEQVAELRAEAEAARARIAELAARESDFKATLAEAETRLGEERERTREKLELVAAAEKQLTGAFEALSRKALDANADSFLTLARQSFAKLQSEAQGDLEQRRQAIEGLLAPFKDQLGRYESGVRELEKARQEAYGSLNEQVKNLLGSQESLRRETSNLVTALRRPEVRGNWGEVQLRRAVEFAGMVEHVDFVQQQTVETDEGRQRPDLIVHLPGARQIVVDAKAPLDAYLDAVAATSDGARAEALTRHARQVRAHLGKLSQKGYWKSLDEVPEFVVLFLPGDSFYTAALESDPALVEDAFRQSVLIATPSTLVALLKSVYYGWKQEAIARNAKEISEAAATLYKRVRVFTGHLADIGKGLGGAMTAYNEAVGSYQQNVVPQGRRIERLASASDKPITDLEPIETVARELGAGGPAAADDPDA